MALPPLVEIMPLPGPVAAQITVPGSKSITNRALILAALSRHPVTLQGALWSEDTEIMAGALRVLGFEIEIQKDPHEPANRHLAVRGLGGRIPRSGSEQEPLELFVGNAGTAARFLAALVCLGQGVYRLSGVPRMHERPQAALFQALRELGYRVDSPNDKLPALIHGAGPRPNRCRVRVDESSQFASALLLGASAGGWKVETEGENADESPYVEMTRQMLQAFPAQPGAFPIEPDASSGSYFWAVNALFNQAAPLQRSVSVARWPESNWQIDARYPDYLALPRSVSRRDDLGDSVMTAIVMAPLSPRPTRFTDLGRLRVQECERVAALRAELTRCGARVIEQNDTLEIHPSVLHGAEIETYNDHRMAMCFAILGLKVPGLRLKNPACVKKTFPNFFAKLAAPPPHGLGAVILDGAGQPLREDQLLAD